MAIEYIYPPFEVIRRDERCTRCRICEKQCANGVHSYNADLKAMISDETKCVDCLRCVTYCPTRALKIVKNDCCFRENENWTGDTIKEIYKQADIRSLCPSTGTEYLSMLRRLPIHRLTRCVNRWKQRFSSEKSRRKLKEIQTVLLIQSFRLSLSWQCPSCSRQ